jgi:hypothetical protein
VRSVDYKLSAKTKEENMGKKGKKCILMVPFRKEHIKVYDSGMAYSHCISWGIRDLTMRQVDEWQLEYNLTKEEKAIVVATVRLGCRLLDELEGRSKFKQHILQPGDLVEIAGGHLYIVVRTAATGFLGDSCKRRLADLATGDLIGSPKVPTEPTVDEWNQGREAYKIVKVYPIMGNRSALGAMLKGGKPHALSEVQS